MKVSELLTLRCCVFLIAITAVAGKVQKIGLDDLLSQWKRMAENASNILEHQAQKIVEDALNNEGVQKFLDIGEDIIDRALDASKDCVKDAMNKEIARGVVDMGEVAAGDALSASHTAVNDALGDKKTVHMMAGKAGDVIEASHDIIKGVMNDARFQKVVQMAGRALDAGYDAENSEANDTQTLIVRTSAMLEEMEASQDTVKELVRDERAKEAVDIGAGVMSKALETGQKIAKDMSKDETGNKLFNLVGKAAAASKGCMEDAKDLGRKLFRGLF